MAGSDPAAAHTLTPIGEPGRDDDTPSASPTARVEVGGRVKQAYSAIQSCTGGVGGDGSQGPIYGEMTIGSMQRVLDCFVEDAGFGPESVFMDVGSGLGKPNIHAACMPSGCRFSIGVECEPTRYNLSMVRLLAAEIGLQWALAAPALRLRRWVGGAAWRGLEGIVSTGLEGARVLRGMCPLDCAAGGRQCPLFEPGGHPSVHCSV